MYADIRIRVHLWLKTYLNGIDKYTAKCICIAGKQKACNRNYRLLYGQIPLYQKMGSTKALWF